MNRDTSIWVVEDSEDDLYLLNRALKEAGFKHEIISLMGAEDVQRQVELYDSSAAPTPPAMILMDFRLNAETGDTVLKRLRAHPPFDLIPILVTSSSGADPDVIRAYRAGANSFLVKPGSYDELVELLHAVKNYWFRFNHLPPL